MIIQVAEYGAVNAMTTKHSGILNDEEQERAEIEPRAEDRRSMLSTFETAPACADVKIIYVDDSRERG